MLNLSKPKKQEREIKVSTAGKVQLNLLVTPAFRREIKLEALDRQTHVNVLIEQVVTDYLNKTNDR